MKSRQEAYSSSWPIDSLLLLPTGHIPVKVVRASGKRRPTLVASDSIATVLKRDIAGCRQPGSLDRTFHRLRNRFGASGSS